MRQRGVNYRKYSDTIYCYDIETSSLMYGEGSDAQKLQSTYLHGLASFKYRPIAHEPFENFEHDMTYIAYRTYEEISDCFTRLNQKAEDSDMYVKIYVHNLSYEFEALMRNVRFCIERFDPKGFIAVAPHQPLMLRCGHLEFYDSFKILGNKSLEVIGNELGVPKLKDIKGGYDQYYYNWTKLPESEYVYNERDCKLVLYALCRYMNNFTGVDSVSDISVSNTSMIKRETRENRNIASKKDIQGAKLRASAERKNNRPFLEFMQDCLAGGYTHANPYATGKHFTDVYCFDASSMHPSAMYGRYFPYEWREVSNEWFGQLREQNFEWLSGCKDANGRGLHLYSDAKCKLSGCKNAEYDSVLQAAYRESLLFEKPLRNNFLARCKFTNIYVRDFGNCIYSYISVSKCVKGSILCGEYDNGKVMKADELVFYGCDIDFILIDMLYDYDSVECDYLLVAMSRKHISKPLRSTVKYFAKQKTGFKKLEKKLANHTATLDDFTFEGLQLYDEAVAKKILNESNDELVHFALMSSKGGLNGQYGCSAMKLLRHECVLRGDGENLSWEDGGVNYLDSKNSINIFTDGLYTVAYSRLHIICFMLYLTLSCNIMPLYHDTDSGYFIGYNEEVQNAIDKFNANILEHSDNKECYNFGIMDFDGHYEDFVTWGSKCYAASYKDGDKLHVKATVAGASKKQLSKLFTAIVNDNDFNYLIDEYFHPNISYDESINKKLIRKTPGTRIVGKFKDDFGEEGWLNECSVTVLEPCGYTLRSLKSPVNQMYYEMCYSLRKEHFRQQIPETVHIPYDKDGNPVYSAYTKKYTEQQYDIYLEGNPASIFQDKCEGGEENGV